MRILSPIPRIKVKRTFVTAQKMRFSRSRKQRFLPELTKSEFLKKLRQAKATAKRMNENQLDTFIANEYQKRADAYNNADWYRAQVSTREIGVWRRAGQLPTEWTNGSLAETALKVRRGFKSNSKHIRGRAKRALPRIIKFADSISKEKYLFPIVFAGGTGTRGRKRFRIKMKGDIDDGCMRSIALALTGRKTLDVYFGIPTK